MANVDPTILQKLSDDLDTLENQLQGVARTISTQLLNRLSDATTETRNLVEAFKEGEDVTKKLSTQMSKMQKEGNKLSLNAVKLQNDLARAQAAGNRQIEARVRKAIQQNQIASKIVEQEQTILYNLQQQAEAQKTAEKAAKEKIKSALSFNNILPSSISSLLTIGGLFSAMVQSVLKINTQVTELSRSLDISYESASILRDRMEDFAASANDGFTTVAKLAKAQGELTEQLGFAIDFGEKETQQFAKLTDLVGLSASEAGKLASFSAAAGESTSSYLKSVRSSAFFSQQANKIHISDKQLLQSISTLSAGILVKFQNNPKALGAAVVQAKALGTTLEQVDNTAESLLNFESSIENELKAELITGRQLNFERARAAALTGDQATLMQEVASQAGSLEEFSSMNVIAQRSLAEAFGMSSDQMAEMLMKQEAINNYGDEAAKLNAQQIEDLNKSGLTLEEYLVKEREKVDLQTRFNTAVERLQEILGNVVNGPLGDLIAGFANLLSNSTALYGIIGAIAAVSFGKAIAGLVTMAIQLGIISAEAITTNAMLTFGAGVVIAGLAVAGGLALLSDAKKEATADTKQSVQDGMAPPGKGPFTITDRFGATAVTAAGDGIAVSPNINKGGGDNSILVSAINELRTAVNALANKPLPPISLTVNGQKLGEVVGRQAETGTNQYQNTYRLA